MINQLNLQNGSSPLMEQMNYFHDWVMLFVVCITIAVVIGLGRLCSGGHTNRGLIESQSIEFLWTAVPCLLLLTIGIPSLRLLYIIDEVGAPVITVKAVGHQWFWSYEYYELLFDDLIFDRMFYSYGIHGTPRLLDCDHRLVLPRGVPIRILVTAADVLHRWTVPAIGIKADAVPGRLNQLTLFRDRPGLFFGQCREICGRNHRYIPISLEIISPIGFLYLVTGVDVEAY